MINGEAIPERLGLLICWVVSPVNQVRVVVDQDQHEYDTGESVGEDVDDDDGDDDMVEPAALLLGTHGDGEVLGQLDHQRDAGGHTVEEGQCVDCKSNVTAEFRIVK